MRYFNCHQRNCIDVIHEEDVAQKLIFQRKIATTNPQNWPTLDQWPGMAQDIALRYTFRTTNQYLIKCFYNIGRWISASFIFIRRS